ncbi:transposase [Arachidicoccus ginsenosidivorans]|uniref:Transposase n=1 Tax=Arachidicoccus ginsenosidivorans TaxID=496057 RepID=A0A5B8VS45_9BACT|nr:transposase [Arachidicoccus ginsenosidivorans]
MIYKTKLAGVPVILVPPANTSQRCHKCGHIEKAGPKTQCEFVYCSCCHGDHADKKAALNITKLGCSRSAHGPVVLDFSKAMKYPRIEGEDMLTKL